MALHNIARLEEVYIELTESKRRHVATEEDRHPEPLLVSHSLVVIHRLIEMD